MMLEKCKEVYNSTLVDPVPKGVEFLWRKLQDAQKNVKVARDQLSKLENNQRNRGLSKEFQLETAKDNLKSAEELCLYYQGLFQQMVISQSVLDPHVQEMTKERALNYSLKKSISQAIFAAIGCCVGLVGFHYSVHPLPPLESVWFWYFGGGALFVYFCFLWVKTNYHKAARKTDVAFKDLKSQYDETMLRK